MFRFWMWIRWHVTKTSSWILSSVSFHPDIIGIKQIPYTRYANATKKWKTRNRTILYVQFVNVTKWITPFSDSGGWASEHKSDIWILNFIARIGQKVSEGIHLYGPQITTTRVWISGCFNFDFTSLPLEGAWPIIITAGGHSAYKAYQVHKSGHKTSIII